MKNFLKKNISDLIKIFIYVIIVLCIFLPLFIGENGIYISLFSHIKQNNTINIFVIVYYVLLIFCIVFSILNLFKKEFNFASYIGFFLNLFYLVFLSTIDLFLKEEKTNTFFFIIYIIFIFAAGLFNLKNIFSNNKFTVYEICEIAILVALALVLDKLKIHIGSTGGSINLSSIPLIILAYRRGALKGFVGSSLIFGLLSCLFDGYGIQYFFFDYFIAFSGYCTIGLFIKLLKNVKNEIIRFLVSAIFCYLTSFITRMIGHTISSIIFYDFTFLQAVIYNVIYVSFSIGISLVAMVLLSKPIVALSNKYKYNISSKK